MDPGRRCCESGSGSGEATVMAATRIHAHLCVSIKCVLGIHVLPTQMEERSATRKLVRTVCGRDPSVP